jgi:NADH-quinone oxidoreductase subunit G
MSTRREAKSGGRTVIKRIMPRQNESVNEIWICDKGRFVHQYAESKDRLTTPLVRKQGALVEATWDEALALVADKLQAAGQRSAALANDRLANEELFLLKKLFVEGLESGSVALADVRMAGGDVVAAVGLSSGSNLGDLGQGDAILVAAADLHEAAPIWWLRVKQAADRGARVVVLNARQTRLDKHAAFALQCGAGELLQTARQLLNAARVEGTNGSPLADAAEALIQAENLVLFYGNDGLTVPESAILARILGNLLLLQNKDGISHAGRRNSGLVPVWPRANTQGAWDLGVAELAADAIFNAIDAGETEALYLVGADPVGQGQLANLDDLGFVVVQELFLTATAALADVVLPAQSWAEREGTYTSGERRVQRFFPAISPVGESRADWQILAQVGERLGLGKAPYACGLVFKQLAASVPAYAGMTYRSLARWEKQWPDVGGVDLYYGGTSYENKSGLGQQWAVAAESGAVAAYQLPDLPQPAVGLQMMSIPALYAAGRLIGYTDILADHIVTPAVLLHAADAAALDLEDGDPVGVMLAGKVAEGIARIGHGAPQGLALLQGMPAIAGTQPAAIARVAPVAVG